MVLVHKQERFTERLFGSKGRVRILKVLTEAGELNHSQICRRVGMNYQAVNDHLEILMELGVVRERRYGLIRMFQVNFDELNIRFKKHIGVDYRFST